MTLSSKDVPPLTSVIHARPVSLSGSSNTRTRLRAAANMSSQIGKLPSLVDDEHYDAKINVASGRKVLNAIGGTEIISKHLQGKLHILNRGSGGVPPEGDLRDMIVEGWIEETLKFLAIKTHNGDTTMPFKLVPSAPVLQGWRILMMMPKTYESVCHAMGNEFVIDHNPYDFDDYEEESEHLKKRFNATLRAYHQCFDQDAPHLFWPEPILRPRTLSQFVNIALPIIREKTNCVCNSAVTMMSTTSNIIVPTSNSTTAESNPAKEAIQAPEPVAEIPLV